MGKETEIQTSIIKYLELHEIMCKRTHTQGVRVGRGRKAKNPSKGMADLYVLLDGSSIWVEVKKPGGIQSEEQKIFQQEVIENGGSYLLVESLQEFKESFISLIAAQELVVKKILN